MNGRPVLFLKSQVSGYTKQDGTYVKPHATKVIPQEKKPMPPPKAHHPKPNDQGQPVGLHEPHEPSDPATWGDPHEVATFVPGGNHRPHALHGIPFTPWTDRPETAADWNAVAGQKPNLDEPPLPAVAKGMHLAAGVVVEEADGRIWTVSPSNRFGGYDNTFPKGTLGPVNTTAVLPR